MHIDPVFGRIRRCCFLRVAITGAAAAALGGCADRFHATAPPPAAGSPPAAAARETPVSVAPLPEDLAWLADGLRLFRRQGGIPVALASAGGSPPRAGSGENPAPDAEEPPEAGSQPMALLPSPQQPRAPGRRTAPAAAGSPSAEDLRFVSLPLSGGAAAELAAVPPEAESGAGATLLPAATRAARAGERTVALPIAARWLALAWDPARLEDSPAQVPPQLEAWLEQLRALHHRRPEHAPLIVAWSEADIAGSFALLLAARGGRLLDEDGRPAFVSPEGEATVQLMGQMLQDGLVQPTALATSRQRLADSLRGPYAYWLCPSDALIAAAMQRAGTERLAALRVGGLPMAREHYHYPEAATTALVQFRGLAVPKGSPRAAAAWRLARFLADPVVLRSAPPFTSVLAAPPAADSPIARQAQMMIEQHAADWPDPPGLSEALGRFLHAALRRILSPREALERAALQSREPGALPETAPDVQRQSPDTGYPAPDRGPEAPGGGTAGYTEPQGRGGGAESPARTPQAGSR